MNFCLKEWTARHNTCTRLNMKCIKMGLLPKIPSPVLGILLNRGKTKNVFLPQQKRDRSAKAADMQAALKAVGGSGYGEPGDEL